MPNASSSAPRSRWARLPRIYRKHEHFFAPLFFLGGVTWDVLTLERVDSLVDNALLLTYLVVLGGLIVLTQRVEAGLPVARWVRRVSEWLPFAIQFFLGALFSAYVIYYARSASLTESALFLVLLVLLLIGNEFIHQRLTNLYLLLVLYYIVTASFFTFFLPVITKTLGYKVFLVAHLIALSVIGGLLLLFWRIRVFRTEHSLRRAGLIVLGVALTMHGLYLFGGIPPIPLALQSAGVYHEVRRDGAVFILEGEQKPWYQIRHTFHRVGEAPVYCFTSIFAPTDLSTNVYHIWQHETPSGWQESDRIGYEVIGGRDTGYRGYTVKQNVTPGRWRVDVITENGRTLGRIRFDIIPTNTPPPLQVTTYD